MPSVFHSLTDRELAFHSALLDDLKQQTPGQLRVSLDDDGDIEVSSDYGDTLGWIWIDLDEAMLVASAVASAYVPQGAVDTDRFCLGDPRCVEKCMERIVRWRPRPE